MPCFALAIRKRSKTVKPDQIPVFANCGNLVRMKSSALADADASSRNGKEKNSAGRFAKFVFTRPSYLAAKSTDSSSLVPHISQKRPEKSTSCSFRVPQ